MAIYHPDQHSQDMGHGTRVGFRIVSLIGVIAFVAFIAWFAFGPHVAGVDQVNPPAGDTNTPTESMAAPEQQPTAPTQPEAQQPPAQAPAPATP